MAPAVSPAVIMFLSLVVFPSPSFPSSLTSLTSFDCPGLDDCPITPKLIPPAEISDTVKV